MKPTATMWAGVLLAAAAFPQTKIAERVRGMEARQGLLTLHLDRAAGKLWIEVPQLGEEMLYVVRLASGLGSNPVGLDRARLSRQHVVVFERQGPKVLLVARNLRFRARTAIPAERRAVRDSFAESVLFAFSVQAEGGDGAVLVDATPLLCSDMADVQGALRRAGQGTFRLDPQRSAARLDDCKAFPENVELEALATFAASEPGAEVRRTAPEAKAVTLRVRHSFVRLPDGYTPRVHDPRVGYGSVRFADYASPITAPLHRRWITRHRLLRQDPTRPRSRPVRPIVYYVDRGTPEPVRRALMEGASWWAEAFAAAGFEDAFRVELLPQDADPLDVRYHVIHWVHRATRGWSYGGSVVDPRTGEILQGNVRLGSLRVRQDLKILRGLRGSHAGCAMAQPPAPTYLLPGGAGDQRAEELALARLRQLAAHEVGHTLGLTHNFAASSYGRASVMDYPAPLARAGADGRIDLSNAYARGVGAYDVWAIRYGYAHPAPGQDEAAMLAAILEEGRSKGMLFLTDADARPPGAAHPLASLWDNGRDPVEELVEVIRVREAALSRFGIGVLAPSDPQGALEEVFVPLYLHHRYQVEAAIKVIGGRYYEHTVAGAPRPVTIPDGPTQRRALGVVLETLEPGFLAVPEQVLRLLSPAPPGDDGERFARWTGRPFDPLAAAAAAADHVLALLLDPQRAARLEEQHARAASLPDLAEVVGRVLARTWNAPVPDRPLYAAVDRVVENVLAERLVSLASDPRAAPTVRAAALAGVRTMTKTRRAVDAADVAHLFALHRRLRAFLEDPHAPRPDGTTPRAPQGAPIGGR